MARKLRETTPRDLIEIGIALELIRNARSRLRDVGAKKAADYLARALKSAEGAERHARRGDCIKAAS